MVMPKTEQEAPPKLEDILSEEAVEVSEDVTEDVTEEPVEVEEEKDEDVLTPENFESKVQAEADKRSNKYREIRESDTALIRRQAEQIAGLRKQISEVNGTKRINRLLVGYDEEGLPEDEKVKFETELKAINKQIVDYNEKVDKVEEMVQFISDMTEQLPPKVVKGFGLDDPNPIVRAKNGVGFLNATAASFSYSENFLMVVEKFLPKGDEVREKIEKLVNEITDDPELKSNKSKLLYLEKEVKGLKVTPRKAPRSPSDGSGGKVLPKLGAKTDTKKLLASGFNK